MRIIKKPIMQEDVAEITTAYGTLFKITVDLNKKILILGCELHVDGAEKLRQEEGSTEDYLWGGWLDIEKPDILFNAVFNLRPRLGNVSMDLLDERKRKQFREIVVGLFTVVFNEQA